MAARATPGWPYGVCRVTPEGVDAVVCEPEENQLCTRQKGALRVEVTVRGRMAHRAMTSSGANPVTRAARFVLAVEELEGEEIERHGEDPLLGSPNPGST